MTRKHGRTARRLLLPEDVRNGALDALLSTASFSLALGFHPVVPLVAFVDGLLGRHLSRLRLHIARGGGDGVGANAAALATHAAIGTMKFGLFINPIGGYGVPLPAILRVSLTNSLSKGTVRLLFDKAFACRGERRRATGVAYASLLTFGQGLLCGLVYKGSGAATALQYGFAAAGIALVLAPTAKRFYRAWTTFRDPGDSEPIVPTVFSRPSEPRIPDLAG
ncbi:MAG: hypothetical protein HY553_03590 [Elusimicrobia bacterium]|nr:hypothetical protein [Elusimicrobiota bacterium]